ncbi:MAG: DegV family protein [Clostridia bacterium]|nr:DegV family protein [Clostridia bacterium]
MKYKIIADSSCDLKKDYLKKTGVDFSIAPLTINVNGEDFVDDEKLDIKQMLNSMNAFKGKSTSTCPSPTQFFDEMHGADKYFIITISSKLSGSFNSANVAKGMLLNPDDAFVIDSKSTSGTMILIVDKLVELINKNISYEEICKEIHEYVKTRIELYFVLDKFDNLAKNGRVSVAQALIASALSIKPICVANDGEIKFAKKAIGIKWALKVLVKEIGLKLKTIFSKSCIISHCFNVKIAEDLEKEMKEKYDFKSIRTIPMRGLCSFYALEKGIIVSFEN